MPATAQPALDAGVPDALPTVGPPDDGQQPDLTTQPPSDAATETPAFKPAAAAPQHDPEENEDHRRHENLHAILVALLDIGIAG